MKPLDIIMINMSGYAEWQHGVSNRNGQLIREFAAMPHIRRILAVDYPPLTLKRALRNTWENIIPALDGGTVQFRTPYDKLTKLSDAVFVYSNSEFFIRPEHFVKRVRQVALKLSMADYLVWSYFPPLAPYMRSFGQKLTVFDAVDNWAEHPSYRTLRERMVSWYATIRQTADVIFTVAEDLQKLFDNQPNVYWVPNGVDLAHYQTKHRLVSRDIADLPRPIIGYIGVIQERVDLDLITYLAAKNQNKTFVLVGPIWHDEDANRLATIKNVHILGYKSYEEAPAYIQQFDVALIPHRQSRFITSTNPMKLYEYLACGKPVVATKYSGVDLLKDVVYVASDKEDFNRKLFLALEEDSEERQDARKKAVEEYSWNAIARRMLDIVSKKLTY
ncbi:MAG: glycosyltransferase [Candidatus Komeilibacteria bacterium]|nr:glycosyltransferase [Candidatus Komeilibacteria bacterium]